MIVGCYSVHLYCDSPEGGTYKCTEWPGEYTGRNEREALANARKAGWRVVADKAFCRKHAKESEKLSS